MTSLLLSLLTVASLVFVARAIISWVRIGPDSSFRPVVDVIYRLTEPVLGPIRQVIPPVGGIDISIILVILVINLVLVPIVQAL